MKVEATTKVKALTKAARLVSHIAAAESSSAGNLFQLNTTHQSMYVLYFLNLNLLVMKEVPRELLDTVHSSHENSIEWFWQPKEDKAPGMVHTCDVLPAALHLKEAVFVKHN